MAFENLATVNDVIPGTRTWDNGSESMAKLQAWVLPYMETASGTEDYITI